MKFIFRTEKPLTAEAQRSREVNDLAGFVFLCDFVVIVF
jgi:hypothetical protein